MVSWKANLKPIEMAQVASYVLQFQGTTPANPKEAEGDIWVDDSAESSDDTPETEATETEDTNQDTNQEEETETEATLENQTVASND
jgi:cytochrome c oxidase cbb3-type subunit 3